MKPRITLVTIGVDDLERSLRFYRDGLGFPTKGIVGQEFDFGACVFFDLDNDLKLALYPRRSLAHDSNIVMDKPSATEFALAHNVNSKNEVDVVLEQAKLAGGKIVKEAKVADWGVYSGYFQDPDGHLWEVAWNPSWKVD